MTYPTPSPINPDADTVNWWIIRLTNELLARTPLMEYRGRYVEGYQDLPRGDKRYMKALRHLQLLAQTNYLGLITSAPTERMKVRGFRFGEQGEADPDAKEIWEQNDMELQSQELHDTAAKYGLAYALVSPPDEDEKWPCITVEDPRTAIVYRDPARPTKALAGFRMWEDDITGYIMAVLYLPEGSYILQGPPAFDDYGMSIEDMRDRLLRSFGTSGATHNFQILEFQPNPPDCQQVMLVEFVWRPNTGPVPEGEADRGLRVLQDRLNQQVFDLLTTGHFQAFKQRWVSGVNLPEKGDGTKKQPFDPGADMLWVTEDADVKFGEFTSADLRQVLEAIRDVIADMAATSKTPAHYLMGKMANISGETLTQAESGLVSKTELRMNSMGWSHERVMKLCFALAGDAEKATDIHAETLWAVPEKQITAELALAGQQWAAIGIPLEVIMERQGFTPDAIAYSVQKKQEADQQALEQQQAMADQQHANAMEMATATGKTQQSTTKPGAPSGGPPKKPSKPPGG
jgi:SPP1 Gp6-like portal protein